MKFAVVGGDVRSALLAESLRKDGHRVYCYALEKAELSGNIKAGCLPSCVYGADCIVLPVPSENAGFVNTPLSAVRIGMSELISTLWTGQLLCGGKFSDETKESAARAGIRVCDLLCDPLYAAMNAALTAEAALALLIENSDGALFGSRALICGWGRIAKGLAFRLRALGSSVTVAARSGRSRAECAAFGLDSIDFEELEGRIGAFPYLINTVPARVLSDELLCLIDENALLLELASPPGGFDRNLAQNISLHTLAAPGLPGKFSPRAAAELMKKTICQEIECGMQNSE